MAPLIGQTCLETQFLRLCNLCMRVANSGRGSDALCNSGQRASIDRLRSQTPLVAAVFLVPVPLSARSPAQPARVSSD